MLYSNYAKQRNWITWEKYRKQRKLINTCKKNSMKNYFLEKSCDFSKTTKPFFSKKSNSGEQKIVLKKNNKIVNDTKQVTENLIFSILFSLL